MLLKKNIPFKYVFGKIKYEIIAIAIYATIIAVLYSYSHLTRITIPLAVPAVLGTVISLLLGFRSNQAYDRWWEARHIWGAIVNDSRSLARQVLSFTYDNYHSEEVQVFRQRIINRQIGWCYALGRHLRNQNALKGLEKYISKEEFDAISDIENTPTALLDNMGSDLHLALDKGWINSYQQVELDRTLSRLTDAMGKCERIKNTVFPHTYSLYIHLSLMLFIGLLPFGVIEYFGYVEVPLVVAISASFLLIEKMAIHLQDPFENKPTDTPMTTIARGIEKNLTQLYGKSTLHKTQKKKAPAYNAVADLLPAGKNGVDQELAEVSSVYVSSKKYFIL
ncbi:bestrophin family protein [Niabella insulamsoli]|uniref:bestrophin family protein n=1 Tax=Niabella insulamsoli TaxID=3144874 RepID=UPI0031FE374B